MEGHIIQLMSDMIVEQHVFGGGFCVAKTISDIEAKGVSIQIRISGSPVPGIIICPYAAAPIQRAEICRRVKLVTDSVVLHIAGSAHAVDFLIIVKMLIPVPGSGNHHGVHFRLLKDNVAVKRLIIPETLKMTCNPAPAVFH